MSYGIGKAAMDRMANDMAVELATENVTMVSLWPGLVKTETLFCMCMLHILFCRLTRSPKSDPL